MSKSAFARRLEKDPAPKPSRVTMKTMMQCLVESQLMVANLLGGQAGSGIVVPSKAAATPKA
jgi:hypothetical protein